MAVQQQQRNWRSRDSFKRRQTPKGAHAGDSEKQPVSAFPRRNWAIIILLKSLTSIAYTVTIPSMHQFITNPDKPTEHQTLVQPGLGQSESFYAWAVTLYSLGEFVGAMGAGFITKLLPYRLAFLLGIAMCPLGYLLYSLVIAAHAWVVLVARLCIGMNAGLLLVLITTYLGETATRVHKSMPHDGSLKDKLFVYYSLVSSFSYLIAPGINSAVAQFPEVNPYRWGAVFVIVLSSLYFGGFLVVFKEHKTFRCGTPRLHKDNSLTLPKASIRGVAIFTILILCHYSSGSCFVVLDTLLNPILSDQFGFTISDSSYFMIGSVATFPVASIILLILKQFQWDNRKVYMLAVFMSLSGAMAMSDWQSVGKDPCLAASSMFNMTTSPETQENTASFNSSWFQYDWDILANECEEGNSTLHQCYWNPNSRVTGKLCKDCYPVCRSTRKSLHFVQFTVGFAIFSLSIPLQGAPLIVVSSDFTPHEYQVTSCMN